MHVSLGQVLGTALATGIVGFLVWLVTVPLRLRSVTGLIGSVVLTGPLAVLGGIGWALILGPDAVAGPESALLLAVVAVLTAAAESGVAAGRAYRRFARANGELRAALGEMADGSLPELDTSRPLLSELETVRTELSEVARGLHTERARAHALDESRRALIAWVSQDLHAPLTVLRAMSDVADVPAGADVRCEVERLVAVVDDLFDLATATPDHAARSLVLPRWEPALLADVLGDAVAALEPLARLRGVGMRVRGATTLQVRLLGPAGDDLGRRLVALMVDAIRHSRPGTSMLIEVSPEPDDSSAVHVELTPGVREEQPAAVVRPPTGDATDASDAADAADAVGPAEPLVLSAHRLAMRLPVAVPA